jgi:hypothetical protein
MTGFERVRNQIRKDIPNDDVLKELSRGLKGVRRRECHQTAAESSKTKLRVEAHFWNIPPEKPRNAVPSAETS